MFEARAHRLLFVCMGNLCRSPMAEGFALHYAVSRGLLVDARSCGLAGFVDRPAEPMAVKVMREVGIDISSHRSEGLEPQMVDWADYILVMELIQASEVRRRFPSAEGRVMLLGNFGGSYEIPDPMGGWRWRFRRVRDQIRTSVEGFLDQLPRQG